MKNWKTSLGGIVGGIGGVLAVSTQYHIVGALLTAVAVTWLGYHATDKV